jgi:hypothetical protein
MRANGRSDHSIPRARLMAKVEVPSPELGVAATHITGPGAPTNRRRTRCRFSYIAVAKWITLERRGPVAQRLEQGTHNPLVVGSNPTRTTSSFARGGGS